MARRPSLLQLLLLGLLLQGLPEVSSEMCYDPICRYTLEVSMQFSLIYNVTPSIFDYYDVDLEPGTDILRIINSTFRPGEEYPIGSPVSNPYNVITLDGFKRKVYTINGQFPGPTIEVTEGAQVVVTIMNHLDDEEISIHWHGFPQEHNAWMDGVPQLTQCPIGPGGSFTYRLTAPHPGTFWYHSHVVFQRADGLAGMFIVHPKSGPPSGLRYFPVMVQDWYHKEGSDYFFADPLATPPVPASGNNLYFSPANWHVTVDGSDTGLLVYVSGLINGRGRYNAAEYPLTRFNVQSSKTYRFYVANTGGEAALRVSVDEHKLVVVGVDSRQVDPITVDSIILFSGERVDFELEANQPVNSYWFRSRLVSDETNGFLGETLAIVEYEGSGPNVEPTTDTKTCTVSDHCTVFNCPFKYYPTSFYSDCIHMSDATRTYTPWERTKFGLDQEKPDEEYFINSVAFKGLNFNAKNFVPLTAPAYQVDSEGVSCDNCPEDDICFCTHTIEIPYNKVIQFVITNIGIDIATPHPIHLHGYNFALVRGGQADYIYGELPTPHPDIRCNNYICNRPSWAGNVQPDLNLQNPPLKDTVVVPSFGYAVIRFVSINPGPWLLHCHVMTHFAQGPTVLLMMVAKERFPPIPVRMPTCTRNFSLTDYEYEKYLYNARKSLITGEGFQKVSPHFTLPDPPTVTPPHPSPPPPPIQHNKGKVTMTVGGVVGTVVAAFLSGVLITVVIILVCRCCCHCCMPMDRRRSHLGKTALVVPSPPAYIGGGPMATYGAPVKGVSYF